MTPTSPAAHAQPRGIARWKLTEPVRFYAYPALLPLLLVAGSFALEAAGPAGIVYVVLSLFGAVCGVEAARASVFSPVGVMRERVEAALRARLND